MRFSVQSGVMGGGWSGEGWGQGWGGGGIGMHEMANGVERCSGLAQRRQEMSS